jgi:hypothetical protein
MLYILTTTLFREILRLSVLKVGRRFLSAISRDDRLDLRAIGRVFEGVEVFRGV